MNVTRTTGLLAAVLATVLVSACGSPPSQAPASGGTTSAAAPSASQEHNQADISFAQGMIPHHQGAVEMAELAETRAASPEVKQLAANIAQAQEPEIEQLRGFLEAWGAEESGGMTGMDHGGMSGMPGMMSDQQMQQLEDATGAQFDRLFLQMMTMHHEGAVQMARTELADGANPQAKALAQKIIDDQTREIEQMRQLLSTV